MNAIAKSIKLAQQGTLCQTLAKELYRTKDNRFWALKRGEDKWILVDETNQEKYPFTEFNSCQGMVDTILAKENE